MTHHRLRSSHLITGLVLALSLAPLPAKAASKKSQHGTHKQVESAPEPEPVTEVEKAAEEPAPASSGPALSGWINASYNASSAATSNLPFGFNDFGDDFQLNQNWIRLDDPAAVGGKETDLGFRVDVIAPGSDWRYTRARGLFLDQDPAARHGFDPISFYLDMQIPDVAQGMQLQIGRFPALFGSEYNDAPRNALVSHSYTFIYNPFTHTGAVTTITLEDDLKVFAGITTGSDLLWGHEAEPTFIGSISSGPQDATDTLLFSWVLGPGEFDVANNFNQPSILDFIYTKAVTSKLTLNLEGLYGWQDGIPGAADPTDPTLFTDVDWSGLLAYAFYKLDDRWTANLRFERFDDVAGQRTGFAGVYDTQTLGATYKPSTSWQFRTEVRNDHHTGATPFEGEANLLTSTTDLIYFW